MIRPPWAEISRTARRPLCLALAGVLVATGGIALLAAPSPLRPLNVSTVYYYSGGAYHLLGLVTDGSGHPQSGIAVSVSSPEVIPPGSTFTGRTNANGIVEGAFPAPRGNFTYVLAATNAGGTTTVSTEVSDWPTPAPEGVVVTGFGDLLPVPTGTYRTNGQLLAFFAGPNGTPPIGYHVRYVFAEFDANARVVSAGPSDNISNTTPAPVPLGTLSAYSAVVQVPTAPAPTGYGPTIIVQVVDPSGAVVAFAAVPPPEFGPQADPSVAAQAGALVLSELALVATLAALIAGSALYGTGRLLGQLDPYLARPIRRGDFLLARYLGLLLPLGAGAGVGWLVGIVGLGQRYGAAPPGDAGFTALVELLVTVAGWLGAVLVLSHLVRTPLRLMTGTVGLLVVFGFLWTPVLVTASPYLGAPWGSTEAARFTLLSSMVNPAEAPSSAWLAVLGAPGLGFVLGAAGLAILWAIGPIVAAWGRAERAD